MSSPQALLRPIRNSLLSLGVAISVVAPASLSALLITSSSDPALGGALVETFDGYAPAYFASQAFLIGTDGFSVTALASDLHIDNTYCGSFGTSGSCLDTLASGGGANDDFDVVFTGPGVAAFGFDLTALDGDWTVETYDASNNLLSTYVILSQSPGLTGFNRRGYFGATEALPIQHFTVRAAGNDRALIDNLAYRPIPEPSIALLAGLGLLGLAIIGPKSRL